MPTDEEIMMEKLAGFRNYSHIVLRPSPSWREREDEIDLRFESGPGMATIISLTKLDLAALQQCLGRFLEETCS